MSELVIELRLEKDRKKFGELMDELNALLAENREAIRAAGEVAQPVSPIAQFFLAASA